MTTPARPGVFVTTQLNPLSITPQGVPGQAIQAFALPYNIGPTKPMLVTSWQNYTSLFGSFSQANGSYLHYAVYQFFSNGGRACYVLRVPNSDATFAGTHLDGVSSDSSTSILTVSAASPGAWGNTVYVSVVSAGVTGRVNINVYLNGTAVSNLVESWVNLSMNPSDIRNVSSLINSPISGSIYITVAETLGGGGYVAGTTDLALTGSPVVLSGGADGSTPPNLATAIQVQYDTIQYQILNLNIPGWTTIGDLNSVIDWAETRGDVFVVIDGPAPNLPSTSAQVANNYTSITISDGLVPTVQAALYGPWLQIADPASAAPGAVRWVPPGGAVLGIWNASDILHGPVKTPAGITSRVAAVQLEANFTTTDLNNLQAAMVNPIKLIPGVGPCVFGGLTLQPGYPNQFISVERVIQMLTHDLIALCQFAIFEPNDANLWAQITSVVSNYLNQQMQSGTFSGNTPATSYQVLCDSSNNSPSSAQSGIVNVQVAVALVSPAEFILITLTQFQGTTTATVTAS
jgi:uncharacterized protein